MRRRPSSLATAIAAIVSVVLVVAGCEARVYGTPPVTRYPATDGRRAAAGRHGGVA